MKESPDWLLIRREEGNQLMPATDLARHLEETDDEDSLLIGNSSQAVSTGSG